MSPPSQSRLQQTLFGAFKKGMQLLRPLEKVAVRVPFVVSTYHAIYSRIKPSGVVEAKLPFANVFVRSEDEGVARPILLNGEFEPKELACIAQHLRAGDTFVDIGANIGIFSVFAGKHVGPSGTVISIEPEPANHELLLRNLLHNGLTTANVKHLALGDTKTKLTLYRDARNAGNPSLVRGNVVHYQDAHEVDVEPLDDVLSNVKNVHVIKMDVQGFEMNVLRGAKGVLEKHKPAILLELWPEGLERAGSSAREVLETLEKVGYTFREVESGEPHSIAEEVRRASDLGFVNVLATCDKMPR
ncbi:MAG: FkbM family methyltransferase [Polyangiaceae bacterium]|nr:FkbM family methyltransferase [Polyangiaceae bacterium]